MRRLVQLSLVLFIAAIAARAAEQPQMLVTTSWLQQHLRDRRLTVLEVGDSTSFEQSHIAGARFVALADLLVQRDGTPNELPDPAAIEQTFSRAGVPDRGRIIIYSRDPIAAARAFFTLDYAGRGADCAILDGGIGKWSAELRPLATGKPSAAAAKFVVRAHPEVVVRLTAMQMVVQMAEQDRAPVAIVDARSPEQFSGAQPGEGIHHPGHIESAINVPWNENLTGGSTPSFRSIADLRELYRNAGVTDDAMVVAYCRTGMQASVTYFVLRYLGREVHLYDGSYIEWNRTETAATAYERTR